MCMDMYGIFSKSFIAAVNTFEYKTFVKDIYIQLIIVLIDFNVAEK